MHRSGSCRGRSSLYLASRSSPATSFPANLYFKLCASLVAGAVAGVSQGAEGGRGEGGAPRPARHAPCGFKMRRMTFISRCLLRMRPRDFRLRTTPAKWEWEERLWGRRRWTDSSSGPWGMGHGHESTGARGTGAQSRLHFRPRHDAARVNSWKWVFKAPQRMLCRFLASTFVSITVTCYPLRCSYPLPLTPTSPQASRCDLTSRCGNRKLCWRLFMTQACS